MEKPEQVCPALELRRLHIERWGYYQKVISALPIIQKQMFCQYNSTFSDSGSQLSQQVSKQLSDSDIKNLESVIMDNRFFETSTILTNINSLTHISQ